MKILRSKYLYVFLLGPRSRTFRQVARSDWLDECSWRLEHRGRL